MAAQVVEIRLKVPEVITALRHEMAETLRKMSQYEAPYVKERLEHAAVVFEGKK